VHFRVWWELIHTARLLGVVVTQGGKTNAAWHSRGPAPGLYEVHALPLYTWRLSAQKHCLCTAVIVQGGWIDSLVHVLLLCVIALQTTAAGGNTSLGSVNENG
jgi:hypothetical protein